MAEKRYPMKPTIAAILIDKRNAFASAQRELMLSIEMAMIASDCPPGANLLTVENGELVVDVPEPKSDS